MKADRLNDTFCQVEQPIGNLAAVEAGGGIRAGRPRRQERTELNLA